MKRRHMITALLLAVACLLPLTGCEKDPLYYRYDYNLTKYITPGEYKGLSAVWQDAVIQEEDILRTIDATRDYYGEYVKVDRAAKVGDTVAFSCTVTLDGQELVEYNEEKGELMLGFDIYGEAFDDALIGSTVGNILEVDRVLPEGESYGEVAGKTVQYTVSVNGIFERQLPEYNDYYVKAYLGYNSVAEYEAALWASAEADALDLKRSSLISQLWPAVVTGAEVIRYPEKEVEEITEQLLAEEKTYTEKVGIRFDEYIKAVYGRTEEEFLAYTREVAQAQVKEEMLIYAIARAEGITVTDEIYHEYAHKYAEIYEMSSHEELEETFTKEVIMQGVIGDLVKELIADNAVITAPEETDAQ